MPSSVARHWEEGESGGPPTRSDARWREDRRLFLHYRSTGDPAAREAIVTQFLPLVRMLAGRYRHTSEPYDDLVQVGAIGLVKAIERFDLDRSTAFSSLPCRRSRERSSVTSETGRGSSTSQEEAGFAAVEDAATLERLLQHLDERNREILRLYVDEDLTQKAIAQRLGLSQMSVSRLMRSAIARLADIHEAQSTRGARRAA